MRHVAIVPYPMIHVSHGHVRVVMRLSSSSQHHLIDTSQLNEVSDHNSISSETRGNNSISGDTRADTCPMVMSVKYYTDGHVRVVMRLSSSSQHHLIDTSQLNEVITLQAG